MATDQLLFSDEGVLKNPAFENVVASSMHFLCFSFSFSSCFSFVWFGLVLHLFFVFSSAMYLSLWYASNTVAPVAVEQNWWLPYWQFSYGEGSFLNRRANICIHTESEITGAGMTVTQSLLNFSKVESLQSFVLVNEN